MFEIKGNSAMKRIAMNRRFRQRLQGFCSRRTRSIQKLRHRSFHGLDFRFKFFPSCSHVTKQYDATQSKTKSASQDNHKPGKFWYHK